MPVLTTRRLSGSVTVRGRACLIVVRLTLQQDATPTVTILNRAPKLADEVLGGRLSFEVAYERVRQHRGSAPRPLSKSQVVMAVVQNLGELYSRQHVADATGSSATLPWPAGCCTATATSSMPTGRAPRLPAATEHISEPIAA